MCVIQTYVNHHFKDQNGTVWGLQSSLPPAAVAPQVRSPMITAGETFGIYFGGQVCGEGSPAAGGSMSPEGRSEAKAHQEGPRGDGGVERRLYEGNGHILYFGKFVCSCRKCA